jgi:dephospho-CoA kinase
MYIGLTGNIACGKSTAAKYFEELGCYTIDADELGRKVMEPESETYRVIVDRFGKDILNNDKSINRGKLKNIVFSNKEKKLLLESIVHPAIHNMERKYVSEIKGKDSSAIIITHAALIIEKQTYNRFDKVIVIYVSKEKQMERLLKRDGIDKDLAKKIIDSQMPIEKKLEKADFIINNDFGFEFLKKEVERIYEILNLFRYCMRQLKKGDKNFEFW